MPVCDADAHVKSPSFTRRADRISVLADPSKDSTAEHQGGSDGEKCSKQALRHKDWFSACEKDRPKHHRLPDLASGW